MSHHHIFCGHTYSVYTITLLNCSRACYLNSQFPSIIHVFSKLYRTIIAEKKEIKLSGSNFRYFRYAKNRISIFIENIDISHQPNAYMIRRLYTFPFTIFIEN